MIEFFRHSFVQNAYLAGTIVAILSACVGYYVVLRGQAFVCESISHVGFTGAAGAALVGINPLLGVFAFTILAAIGMGALGKRLRGRDVEIGMILSFILGLVVLFLGQYTRHAAAAVNLLFGSILSVNRQDLGVILAASLLSLLILAIISRPLLFASIDPEVSEARGIPVQALALIFLVVQAITISVAIQVVGVLLVFALIIIPAAAAEYMVFRPSATLGVTIIISLVSALGGLTLAFIAQGPPSFYIVCLATGFYLISVLISRTRTTIRYRPEPHPDRETFMEITHNDRS